MYRKVRLLGGIVCTLGAIAGLYFVAFPTYKFRYQLTVTVDTPEGTKSGASVIEVQWTTIPPFMPLDVSRPYSIAVRGSAVFVDLSPRPPLILTLTTAAALESCRTCVGVSHLPLVLYRLERDRSGLSKLATTTQVVDARPSLLPGFLTFERLLDPASARPVDGHNLERFFGPGVRLRGVTLQPTEAPIGGELLGALPWIKGLSYYNLIASLPGTRGGYLHVYDLLGED